jgi:ABC-type transporter Mla MlaB component
VGGSTDRALAVLPDFESSLVPMLIADDQRRYVQANPAVCLLLRLNVLLDLDKVSFIDCRGLSAILRAQNSAVRKGRHLAIRYRSSQVRRLLELTGLLDRFTIE